MTTKLASNSPVTFVTHTRFAVLFFQPSCYVNSQMNLCNGTGEERRQTLCDKRDVNNFVLKKRLVKLRPPLRRSFSKWPRNILSEDHDKHTSNILVTFVTHERYRTFCRPPFLPSFCVNSIITYAHTPLFVMQDANLFLLGNLVPQTRSRGSTAVLNIKAEVLIIFHHGTLMSIN